MASFPVIHFTFYLLKWKFRLFCTHLSVLFNHGDTNLFLRFISHLTSILYWTYWLIHIHLTILYYCPWWYKAISDIHFTFWKWTSWLFFLLCFISTLLFFLIILYYDLNLDKTKKQNKMAAYITFLSFVQQRFSAIQAAVRQPAQGASVPNIRAKMAAQQQASAANKRLAMQMANRPSVQAALKIKKVGM